MYFRSLQRSTKIEKGWGDDTGTLDHICNSYERNIMVDHYGMARLCFSPRFPGQQLDKPGDLTRFWHNADSIRARMRDCNAYCGISHSVRRENATLKGPRVPDMGVAARNPFFAFAARLAGF
jgi:hypothetical protein